MTTIHDTALVVLDRDQADELAFLLGRVEDWLRHTSGDTRADLAEFLDGAGHGRLAAAGLIDTLAGHTAMLNRRLKQAGR